MAFREIPNPIVYSLGTDAKRLEYEKKLENWLNSVRPTTISINGNTDILKQRPINSVPLIPDISPGELVGRTEKKLETNVFDEKKAVASVPEQDTDRGGKIPKSVRPMSEEAKKFYMTADKTEKRALCMACCHELNIIPSEDDRAFGPASCELCGAKGVNVFVVPFEVGKFLLRLVKLTINLLSVFGDWRRIIDFGFFRCILC